MLLSSFAVKEIWRFKDNGVTTLTFWSYVTSSVLLPMGGLLWPSVYLASLWRWRASNVGRTHRRTNTRVISYSIQCYALH